jgi:hypothetical protein
MTYAPAALRRSFDIHGVTVDLRADEHTVIEAVELRLRDFRSAAVPEPDLRLEFLTDGAEPPEPPPGAGRPVYDTPHGSLQYYADADAMCGELSGVYVRCEPARGVARFRTAAFAGRELYMATHPLVTISLMEMLERRGLFSVHAACVSGEDRRGVLLAGPSGAGKSTLALSLARAGMSFLSDDVVFLARDGDPADVRVLGFADAIGLTAHAAEHFAELRVMLGEPPIDGFPKRLARIEELFGAPSVRICEPRALVFPEVVSDQPSRLAPLDGGDALLRLVPDVLLTDSASTKAHLEAIAALLKRARCYELRAGRDLERAAVLVRALI